MSVLLYIVGVVTFVAGAVAVGFGIPIELSFGNTLISAGTTAAVGGLVVFGLGVVVAQLQRISETLATAAPVRPSRPMEIFDPARAAPASQIPFPPKPKADTGLREPTVPERAAASPPELPFEEPVGQSFAPVLRNPDEMTVEEEVSLSPQQPPAEMAEPKRRDETRDEPTLDAGWRSRPLKPSSPPAAPAQARQTNSTYFDAMWPAESKPARGAPEAKPEPKPEPPLEPALRDEPAAPEPPAGEGRNVAILKSGVVDGMGYTLYVDGSIEAELPQGTLHFASINELRSHLEKNS